LLLLRNGGKRSRNRKDRGNQKGGAAKFVQQKGLQFWKVGIIVNPAKVGMALSMRFLRITQPTLAPARKL
jgi:hypothetical protein